MNLLNHKVSYLFIFCIVVLINNFFASKVQAAAAFQAVGSLAVNATINTQDIVAPASQAGDILIAVIINKALTNVISAPDATWTSIYQAAGDTTLAADDHRVAIYWKLATGSGGTFTFTKATDDNVLFGGVISAWRGVDTVTPLDTTTRAAQVNAAAADNVTFPAYDPTGTNSHILFIAIYGNDLTTFAAAMSNDVNPDVTTRYDLETSTGSDVSIAVTSGDTTDGSNIASRTWASVSTADAGSSAIVFGLRVGTAPSMITRFASDVKTTSALLNGKINDITGGSPTVRGFAYGTNSTLATVIATTTDTTGQPFSAGEFTGTISSLTIGTTYYFRAYATSGSGTGFGSIQKFVTDTGSVTRRLRLFQSGRVRFTSGRIFHMQR